MSTSYLPPNRIYQRFAIDSTRWEAYIPRPGDIVISTAPKSGTTWTQSIVRELIVHAMWQAGVTDLNQFPGPDRAASPWLEAAVFGIPLDEVIAGLEAQPHRRFIKTHLPLDGLPLYPQVKYLVVARDQRDVFMSLWHYYGAFTDETYAQVNNRPDWADDPFPRCPADIHDFWAMWIGRGCFDWEHQGYPFLGTMHHVQSWWDYRHLDNILLLHYADMLADPGGEIGRLADFLEIEISDGALAQVVEETSLGAMRQQAIAAEAISERKDKIKIGGGAKTFFNKGTNKRWQGVLTEAELAIYEQTKARVLTPDCARWLELGRAGLG